MDEEFNYEEKPIGLKSSLVNLIGSVVGATDLIRYISQGFIPQRLKAGSFNRRRTR
tara:strand:- start:8962 stop:9129 length:168 start_codon:yes stop_codon:yes gene_type:complete